MQDSTQRLTDNNSSTLVLTKHYKDTPPISALFWTLKAVTITVPFYRWIFSITFVFVK